MHTQANQRFSAVKSWADAGVIFVSTSECNDTNRLDRRTTETATATVFLLLRNGSETSFKSHIDEKTWAI